MKTYEVALDLDGVVFDFIGSGFEAKFGTAHRDYVSLAKRYPERAEEIARWVNAPSTYMGLAAMQVGVQIAQWLARPEQDCAVHIVTARPIGTREITIKELRKNDVPYNTITFKKDKPAYIKTIQPDMVIDDIISILEGVWPIPGVLVEQDYNETPFFPRIRTVDQFIAIWQRHVNENVPNHSRGVGLA